MTHSVMHTDTHALRVGFRAGASQGRVHPPSHVQDPPSRLTLGKPHSPPAHHGFTGLPEDDPECLIGATC